MKQQKKKVLLIGCDAADWKIIHPLVDQGQMPAMAKILKNGVIGNLSTLQPVFSPMLWTSIATGKRADKHGILGFIEPENDLSAVRPVSSLSRKTKAIWNILNQSGYKSHVIGWWPSYPVEKINGIMVSNLFHKIKLDPKEWQIIKNSVHPELLEIFFHNLLMHPIELTDEHILPFVPNAASVDQEKDKHLQTIGKLICEAANIHNAATWALENQEWDFAAVYFDMIDHFCHGFMQFHPPKISEVDDKQYELYKDVINAAYRFQDMLIGRLVQLAGDDATVIIVSDHGFHSDERRMKSLPHILAAPSLQHRHHGVFAISGPGIKKDESIYGASLLDITPTILSLFGLPIGKDMDGVPLVQIYSTPSTIESIASWDNVEGNHALNSNEDRELSSDNPAVLKQLIDLGYIENMNPKSKGTVEKCMYDNRMTLAKVYIDGRKHALALPVLEEIYAHQPDSNESTLLYIDCLFQLSQTEKASEIIQEFEASLKKKILSKKGIAKINAELEAMRNEQPQEDGKGVKKSQQLKASNQAGHDLRYVKLLKADLLVLQNQDQEAMEIFESLLKEGKLQTNILSRIGNSYLKMGMPDKALVLYRQLIEIMPENAQLLTYTARALMLKKNYEEAAENLITATGINFYLPTSHFLLGQCFFQMTEYQHAAGALEVALKMNPALSGAKNLLINIYQNHLNDLKKADQLTKELKEGIDAQPNDDANQKEFLIKPRTKKIQSISKEDIIIVSGLPRSGTSLMMQILDKSGFPILTDKKRTADDNNPKGYFEFELVKNIARNKKWIPKAQGKVVKIVSPLLKYLPPTYSYKIVFMHRDVREIVESQEKMKESSGKGKENTYPAHLEITYKKHITDLLEWFSKKHNIEVVHINYNTLLTDTENEMLKLKGFLGSDKPIEYQGVIDSSLYRNRNKK